MNLYHYYDKSIGPFLSLSDVPGEQATEIMRQIAQKKPQNLCAKRAADYMDKRLYYEDILRKEFLKKGGIMKRQTPHYMVVEECEWLQNWYEDPMKICIPIEKLDVRSISFTYGDSHPTFSERVKDGRVYRKKLYTYEEILEIIDHYGLPQLWNRTGEYGPERYIEAHIWSDEVYNYVLN